MQLPDHLLTLFSAEIDKQNETPTISVPQRELDLGDLDADETYRIAVFPHPEASTGSADEQEEEKTEQSKTPSGPPVHEGEICEVEIEDVGEQGDGIARVGPGYIVFVPETAIGDRVTVEITTTQENFAFADVIEDEPIQG